MIDDIARGLRTLEEIIGQPVTCSAAAGWRADQQVIEAKSVPFALQQRLSWGDAVSSIARIRNPGTAQIPVTLPTGMK